ncbi:hypothetical protein LRY64_00210 [Candidatus Woesebacteria bacterium]|nr:hypothetical protein [Candidatus Woesebacteria bacterium]
MKSIKAILKESSLKLKAKNITQTPTLEAEILLAYALKKPKEFLYSNNEYILNAKEESLYNNLIQDRLKNRPIAYILQKQRILRI